MNPMSSAAYQTIENKAALPVLTPSLQQRETKKILLDNGLEAIVISDPQADKSAAALAVKVGMWMEPSDKPGLAHFLEHMLFMGTEKYPNENDFDQYLSDFGGSSDGFTTNDFTAYFFDVETPAFEGALDRFSRFFKEPLFNASGTGRELKAIDQEYAKNVENDDLREYQVLKIHSQKDHPFYRFSMGNSNSLANVTREDLINWYRKAYSSNLMRLVVISPLPLETLISWVESDFGGIINLNISQPPYDASATNPENLGKIAYIEPIKNQRKLNLIWEISSKFLDLEAKPELLICSVLGDEGPTSLLAQLKAEKLAETLTCGLLANSKNLQSFYIQVGLTELGVKDVNTVIERVFQTISFLKKEELPPYIYEEVKQLARLHYQYQPRVKPFEDVSRHASQMAYEKLETYPEQTEMITRFDPMLVKDMLNTLTPQKAYYQLSAPTKLTGVESIQTEPWVGVAYALKAIPKDVLLKWQTAEPHSAIALPDPNPYLSTDLQVVNSTVESDRSNPIPALLLNDGFGAIYFAPDTQFGLPLVAWEFQIKTPQVNPSSQKAALADLYALYITDVLSSSSYAAAVAGIGFELKRDSFGFNLKINGYSEKASLLLEHVLHTMVANPINEVRFKRIKALLMEEYANFQKEMPYLQAMEWMNEALFKTFAMPSGKMKVLENVAYERFQKFSNTVLAQTFIEGVLYGNMDEKQANDTIALLRKILGGDPFPKGKDLANRPIHLPPDKGPFYWEHPIQANGNAVILAIENGPFDFKSRSSQQILLKAMGAPFFNMLRTQQQTAYIVTNYAIDVEKMMFSCFLVQSNSHQPRDLISRFELFIEGYLQELRTNLTEERFKSIKSAIIQELKHPAKNQDEMADLLYMMAFKYKGDFTLIENRIKSLIALSYEDCIAWAFEQYGQGNRKRLALCMKGKIPIDRLFDYQKLTSLKQLHSLSNFSKIVN